MDDPYISCDEDNIKLSAAENAVELKLWLDVDHPVSTVVSQNTV